ncbi:hypothetical protein SNE40_001927 [Patella caerulea]
MPYYKRKYTENENILRTHLADDINKIARELKGRTVLQDHQLKRILAVENPEDRVSELISTLKEYRGGHFDAFMDCLTYFHHDKLVKEIKGEPVTRSHTQQTAYKKAEDDTRPVCRTESVIRSHTQPTAYQKVEDDTRAVPGSQTQQAAYHKVKDDTGPVPRSQTQPRDKNEVCEITESGSMKDSHERLWISMTERIVYQLQHDLDDAMMRLYQAWIIDLDDKNRINKISKEKQEVDAARELVDLLRNRGDNVLERIIKALKPKFNIAKELEYELNN